MQPLSAPPSLLTQVPRPEAEPFARRRAQLALSFVLFSLLALLVVPFALQRYIEGLRVEAEERTDPARRLIDDVELGLAREVSAIRGWLLTDEEAFRSFFYDARGDAEEALAKLEPLVEPLGPEAAGRLRALRAARDAWLAPNLMTLSGEMTPAALEDHIPVQQERYVAAIEAAKHLHEALAQAVEQRRATIRTVEWIAMYLSAFLALIALASVLIIVWYGRSWRLLTQRLYTLARDFEEQAHTAQAAVRTRDEVLAMVSHDLRSPLTAMGVSARMLQQVLPTNYQRTHLAIITRSADRMHRLIQDILDVTRIEAGRKLTLEPVLIEIDPLVTETVESFRGQAEGRLQQLACRVEPNISPLFVDPVRLQQVLSNLLSNAVKFTPEGGSITVDVRAVPAGVQFAVADTGPGLAEHDLERVFEPYWQARQTARLGAGLGLAISKGIVNGHGGCIWVKSEPGAGSTFFFMLPAAAAPATTVRRGERAASEARTPEAPACDGWSVKDDPVPRRADALFAPEHS